MSDAALFAALAEAQAEFPAIPKSATVDMTLKSGRRLTYTYATFEEVVGAIRKPLAANGLSFSHLLSHGDNGRPYLKTMLMHKDGGRLEAEFPLPVNDSMSAQEIGSAITYMRRYALVSMLGLATDEDDDGGAATDAVRPASSTATPAAPAPKPAPKPPDQPKPSQFQPPAGADTPQLGVPIAVGHEKNLPAYQIESHITKTFTATGEKNGRAWTRWDVYVATASGEDIKCATFSETLGTLAESLTNTTCVMRYTEEQKGDRLNRNIVALEQSARAAEVLEAAYEAIGIAAAAAGPVDPNADIPFRAVAW